ncbi:MAG: YybH family protein [Caulobacteraceae bacterium]
MIHRVHRGARAIAGAAALAALAACSQTTTAPPAADTSKDVAAITAAETQFNADYKARAVDKLVGAEGADYIGYIPFSPVQNGPDNPKTWAADFAKDPAQQVTLTPDRIEVAKAGDLGYVVGHYASTGANPQTHVVENHAGGYVTVYRKQADGGWKSVAVSVSPGPPATATPPAAKS